MEETELTYAEHITAKDLEDFSIWWEAEGIKMINTEESITENAKRLSAIAWTNGAYCGREK